MPNTPTNGVVAIPKWFLGVSSAILVGVIPWAVKQSIDTASTKFEVQSIAKTLDIITSEQTRRIDRNETRIDKLHDLHNDRPGQ